MPITRLQQQLRQDKTRAINEYLGYRSYCCSWNKRDTRKIIDSQLTTITILYNKFHAAQIEEEKEEDCHWKSKPRGFTKKFMRIQTLEGGSLHRVGPNKCCCTFYPFVCLLLAVWLSSCCCHRVLCNSFLCLGPLRYPSQLASRRFSRGTTNIVSAIMRFFRAFFPPRTVKCVR